jgi:hypothetical protein
LHEKVTPEQRLSQGHHSDPNSSLDTYIQGMSCGRP